MVPLARPTMHTAEVRTRLLDAAVSLLAEKGVDDLSLHEVAASANTSTTAVYTLFGGKRELVAAVVKEGFRMFAASQSAPAPRGLLALGRA